jgi:heme/copper-type cytochrome/quinol oxidase subunit 4
VVRKLGSIICYVVAGFFVYTVCLLAFVSEASAKYAMAGAFFGLAVAFVAAALAISQGRRWRYSVGLVLLSGTGVAAVVVGMIFFLWVSPETRELFPMSSLDFFSDYLVGSVSILVLAGLGCWLVISDKRANAELRARERRTEGGTSLG